MKTILDPTRSKRPIRSLDDVDLHTLERQRDDITAAIQRLDETIQAMETDDGYRLVVGRSRARLTEIAMNAIRLDPMDTHAHASAIGQFNERLLLTEELTSAKGQRVMSVRKRSDLMSRIHSLISKMKPRKETQQHGRGDPDSE